MSELDCMNSLVKSLNKRLDKAHAQLDAALEHIAALREGLAQASEAVAHLLDLYNPDGLDDPGPNIPSDLLRWRVLLPPPASDQQQPADDWSDTLPDSAIREIQKTTPQERG